MARIGSVVDGLTPDELKKRIIVTLTAEQAEDPFDSGWVWNTVSTHQVKIPHGTAAAKFWLRLKQWLKRWRPFRRAKSKRLAGLRQSIEHTYITAPALHDGVDIAHLAIPFRHYCLCTNRRLIDAHITERNLAQRFKQHFGRYAPDVRFHYAHQEGASLLNIHFGFGVFVPEPNDPKVGTFQIQSTTKGSPWVTLSILGKHDAAFYPGQKGIAFSSQVQYTPAYDHSGILPVDHVFYFGVISDDPTSTELRFESFHISELVDAPQPDAAPKSNFTLLGGAAALCNEGAPIVVLEDQTPVFRFRWLGLQGTHALRPYVEGTDVGQHRLVLEGLLLPECSHATKIASWGIDFTQTGRLASAIFSDRAFALGCKGDRVQLYDRQRFKQPAVDFERSSKIGDTAYWLGDVKATMRTPFWRWQLRGLQPLGVIPLDGLSPFANVTVTPNQMPPTFLVDWIDTCSQVTERAFWGWIPVRTKAGAHYPGLASWHFQTKTGKKCDAPKIRLTLMEDHSLAVQCNQNAHVAIQHADQSAQRLTQSKTVLQPGDTLIIGCYRFRYDVTQEASGFDL